MCRVAPVSLLLALVAATLVAAEPNTLTDAEKAAGWKLLFDGKTTNGWRNYKKPDIAAGWKVENGEALHQMSTTKCPAELAGLGALILTGPVEPNILGTCTK